MINNHIKKIFRTFLGGILLSGCMVLLMGWSVDEVKGVARKVEDRGVKGIRVSYSIPEVRSADKSIANSIYSIFSINSFGSLREVGRPALPVRYDLILIPNGAKTKLSWNTSNTKIYRNITIHPALKPATDRKGDPEPVFEIDAEFYQSQVKYPEAPVKLIRILRIKGFDVAMIRVCPFQYQPSERILKAYHEVSYDLAFREAIDFKGKQEVSSSFIDKLSNLVLNASSLKKDNIKASGNKAVSGPAVNYIIITPNEYLEAADSLAEWKAQQGYTCEVVSAQSWTSSAIKSAVFQRYQQWNPKPDYLVLLGDHNLVPGEIHQDPTYGDNFATDLYYVCMDGTGDNIPDMAFGRISVASASQAMAVVRKIIRYEKNPPLQTAFYQSGVNCANFQDDDSNSYEDRRFALTEEELRNYMTVQQGFSITRIYQADSYVTPLYWNNDYYAAGEPVPAFLQKPTFAWDGDKYGIRDELNQADGRLFITHRDHGFVGGSGWANPQFTTSDINMLNNGDRTPVVFSINCHTGEYQLPECFAEKFLRYPNGGAAGVFGAAYYSYSGYNDGLILGMFDAIWSNPGILPDFTGYADNPSGSPTPHSDIYTMGDVLNQGMIRMIQTWGDDNYTHELFHYFGDPAMELWTGVPVSITATHGDSLFCGDTVFEIFSSSCPGGLATLVVNGQLIAKTTLTAGAGILHFAPLAGTRALLTISSHNYRPFTTEIPIDSGCVRAAFSISDSGYCINRNFTFTNHSAGNIASCQWNFGNGALPATASTYGPHTVRYSSPGTKTISLTVNGAAGSHTTTTDLSIGQVCSYVMLPNEVLSVESCNGVLSDNGGSGAYAPNTNDTAVITAPGATSLRLVFTAFDVEPGSSTACNYDWLSIYDGPSTAGTLLGTWCNTAGMHPPAYLMTTTNSFTVVFHSDTYTQMQGFDLEWVCAIPMAAPNTNFSADKQWTCDGEIHFTDYSLNDPTQWRWDFGDGDTSVLQHPDHIYQHNGVYTVTLTASNAYGSNTYTHTEYITVERPEAPVTVNDMICTNGAATLEAIGSGTIYWYTAITGGIPLDSGSTLTTPLLTSTTSYFAEDRTSDGYHVAPADSALGNGAYYTGTSNHFLRFDALSDLTLVSVKVYAQNTATRKISLRNASGVILYDTTIVINAGMQRISLNYPVPEGTGYRLQCDSVNRLYRNAGGATFPYTIPEVISITGNSYSNQNYYYYFYDWEVSRSSCTSARAEAIAWVHTSNPVAAFTSSLHNDTVKFIDQSANAASWQWDFGDGNQSVLQNPDHVYASTGSYLVHLTVSNGCGNDLRTDTVHYYLTGTEDNENLPLITLDPNPAHDQVSLEIPGLSEKNLRIELTDMTGRKILTMNRHHVPETKYSLNIAGLASGVYLLTVSTGENCGIIKLIKY